MDKFSTLFADKFGSWQVEVTHILPCPIMGAGHTMVIGAITCYKDGQRKFAGRFARTISGDTIEHSSLFMEADFQGRGFAGKWLARCEKRYRLAGYCRITTVAIGDGSCVWAKFGFVPNAKDFALVKNVLTRRIKTRGLAEKSEDLWMIAQQDIASVFVRLAELRDRQGNQLMHNIAWEGTKELAA